MDLIFGTYPFLLDQDCRYVAIPNDYLIRISLGKRPETVKKYAGILRRYLHWCEETSSDWETITLPEMWEYAKTVKGDNNTFNTAMFQVKQFYRFANLKHDIDNPLIDFGSESDKMKLQRQDIEPPAYRSKADVNKFIRGFTSERDRLMAKLYRITGLRLNELRMFPRSFLDTPPVNGEVPYTVVGKGGRVRFLSMAVEIRDMIAAYAKTTSGPFIFTNDNVNPVPRITIEKAYVRNSKRTGVTMWPHLLRHVFATDRLVALEREHKVTRGENSALKQLQVELGHRNINTTSIYLHVANTAEASKSMSNYHTKVNASFNDE